MKRLLILLFPLAVACGQEPVGTIDLVIENQTSAQIAIDNAGVCSAGHVGLEDAEGNLVNWRVTCPETNQTRRSIRARAPQPCVKTVTWIAPGESHTVTWDGWMLSTTGCEAGAEQPFVAEFCHGTQTSTSPSDLQNMPSETVSDASCADVSFTLGVDAEARRIVTN